MHQKADERSRTDIYPKIFEKLISPSGEMTKISYSKGRFLGKGGFARVYELINDTTGDIFACKFIEKDAVSKSRARHKLMSEIKIHKCLHHPNIVQFFHFFENEDYVQILLELCPNQSLSELMKRRKRLTQVEAQSYMFQVLNGIKYLHSHKILHRDIKLGNIFLSEKMEVKIGDLGLAAKLEYDGERKKTICGTPNYIAPEILDGRVGHSFECDVWSLGVLLYTLLIGKPPFETKDIKTTYRRIKMNLYTFPENVELSDEAKALIGSILILDYNRRPGIDQILAHEFFTKLPFPKFLPISTLAIPPSQVYLSQFLKESELVEKQTARAFSQESRIEKAEPIPKSTRRFQSKETKREKETAKPKITPYLSSYPGTNNDGPMLWVTKWLDYSSRYGVGYVLSNDSVGVIFNDSTKIIMSPDHEEFQYISSSKLVDVVSTHTFIDYPTEINKKVMLLQLFQKQLKSKPNLERSLKKPFDHVKKWASTSHAMIFRLTNKVIQVVFRDSTELFLSSEKKSMTFVNKGKEVLTMMLAAAMESGNKHLIKRLKYSKEVLTTMLKAEKKEGKCNLR